MNTVAVAASVEIAENFVSRTRRDCYSKVFGVKAIEKLGGEALVLEPCGRSRFVHIFLHRKTHSGKAGICEYLSVSLTE